MNRQQAKEILHSYRSNGGDAGDPTFAEALEMTKHDAELRHWFEEQQAFDRNIAGALRVNAPVALRAQILARGSSRAWWNRSLRPAEMAVAACVVLLGTLVGFWLHARHEQFAELRDKVVQRTWDGRRHVDLETTNLAEIRRFISAEDLHGDFKLPPELAAMPVRGCRLMNVDGHRVPYICFGNGAKHIHLAILDNNVFPAPTSGGEPEFAKWNGWTTATWTHDDDTFVLTGMRPLDFVRKFRKERQWTWGG
jgi:hypothetical protein